MTAPELHSRKPIPITLISGFLGSGKTTLLEKILTADHGLKIAVIINDMSTLNIDAALIRDHKVTKKDEKLIQLQNGCICCTLRGDLLDELVTLSKAGEFQYILIESTGISEPMQVAETFTTEFTEVILESKSGEMRNEMSEDEEKVLREIIDLGGLNKITKLDTCVTVIDSQNFISNFETTDFLVDRYGDNGQNEQDRTITDLLIDQVEFANVIILNKVSHAKKSSLLEIRKMIQSLNPVAKIIECDYCDINVQEIVNSSLFDFEVASTSAGWLQSLHEMTLKEGYGEDNKLKLTPKPETEEYGINNFVYKSRTPFHPERLYRLIRDKFVVIEQTQMPDSLESEEDEDEEDEDEEEVEEEEEEEEEHEEEEFYHPSNEEVIENKKNSPFGPLLRSKGFFWLASRHIIRGEWSSAGTMLTLKGGIPWFDVTRPDHFTEETKSLIEKDMVGEFGDRRNEIVFIGLNIDKEQLTKTLDSCLLTKEELFQFQKTIRKERNLFYIEKKLQSLYKDGFEDWVVFDDHE